MTNSALVNGFTSEEIIVLYKYMCWFEKIKSLTTDKSLYQQYPYQRRFWDDFKKCSLSTRKVKEMPKTYQKQPNNNLIYTLSAKTKQLSFLRHLRNSIAHGVIETDSKVIVIRDYSQRAKKCTCMGNLNKSLLMKFLQNQVS